MQVSHHHQLKYKKPYIIGIGGSGVSNIAYFFINKGITVYGSDGKSSPITEKLIANGAQIFFEQKAENILEVMPDAVFYSQAVLGGSGDAELKKAQELGIPCFKNAEGYQELIAAGKKTIAISGAHGKTTTTALTGLAFKAANLEPEVISGSSIKEFNYGSYQSGNGEHFVVEACEYREQFLALENIEILTILNIDFDHPDYFADLESTELAFHKFAENLGVNGKVLIFADDEVTFKLSSKLAQQNKSVFTYGESSNMLFIIENIQARNEKLGYTFQISLNPKLLSNIEQNLSQNQKSIFPIKLETSVIGKQNVWNSTAAILNLVLAEQNITSKQIFSAVEAIAEFNGTNRRQELVGVYQNIPVYDDYAHHPTQISLTLAGFKQSFKKVGVLFEPHQYSRTAQLLTEFAEVLKNADLLALFPIYAVPGRDTEADKETVSIEKLYDLILQKSKSESQVKLISNNDPEQIKSTLNWLIAKGCDCILNMGAGPLSNVLRKAL